LGAPPLTGRLKETAMAKCDVCGNQYDKSFEVRMAGKTFTFDSFECAIHELAPECEHCGCRIVGHGVEANGLIFCCASCARHVGVNGTVDRAGA
jgi:hypothetical protein